MRKHWKINHKMHRLMETCETDCLLQSHNSRSYTTQPPWLAMLVLLLVAFSKCGEAWMQIVGTTCIGHFILLLQSYVVAPWARVYFELDVENVGTPHWARVWCYGDFAIDHEAQELHNCWHCRKNLAASASSNPRSIIMVSTASWPRVITVQGHGGNNVQLLQNIKEHFLISIISIIQIL